MEITGKFNNIKASLDRYMYDNFVTTESLTVDWQGSQGIDIEKVDEWVSPRIIGGGKTFVGNISSSTKGWNAEILLNINIFVKKAQLTTNNRLFVLRDTIANYDNLTISTDMDRSGNDLGFFEGTDVNYACIRVYGCILDGIKAIVFNWRKWISVR